MKNLLYTFILTATFLAAHHAASAAEQPPERSGETKPVANGLPFRGKISAIDKAMRTLSLAGKEKTRTYQITETTRIKKDGKPATLADLTVGETVGGYALRSSSSSSHPEVVTLNLGKRGSAAPDSTPEPADEPK